MTASCRGCGHIFYQDSPLPDGRCHYCHSDDAIKCVFCGATATCSGSMGYMCNSPDCARRDYFAAERKYREENPREFEDY